MEVIEIVVFLTITIIIGSMVILFVADIDEENMYGAFSSILYGSESTTYEQVNKEGLARAAFTTWRDCGQGAQEDELVVTYNGDDEVTRESMFEIIRKFNLCYTIQSGHDSCGTRNDVEFLDNPQPGGTVVLRCDVDDEQLKVSTI